MPDISMFKDENCPLNISCYRYTAEPSNYQSYLVAPIYNHDVNECDLHWPNEDYEQK